jgi:hypothetical protein
MDDRRCAPSRTFGVCHMENQNCWEFWKCEPDRCAVCPAFLQGRGRMCWYVAGTFSPVPPTERCIRYPDSCLLCEFYQHVRDEERAAWDRGDFVSAD